MSAIEHAAQLVLALHAADFGDPDHPLLGRPSANVGTINGGNALNVVAESCVIGLDRRLLPGATAASAEAGVRARIDAAGVARATGRSPGIIGMSFTTDARFVRNQARIPTVVCGPGAVEQAHGNDEWVAVDRLVDATAAYAELLAEFG